MKIVFLYTELADYFVASVKELVKNDEVKVHIVRWPLKAEAPFSFRFYENIVVYERKEMDNHALLQLVEEINPDLIISSGWMDKGYVATCKRFKGRIPVVASMDNHWHGSMKQRLARILSPFTLRRYFDYLWVPGAPQVVYAKKLGFRDDQIFTGYYSADIALFEKVYQQKKKIGKALKRFIYVGRYVKHKGIFDMWDSFLELKEEMGHEWELVCLGAGQEWPNRKEHPAIQHIGFVQPTEMQHYLSEAGVFVLPSHFEPWGVVVHEMAAAGFPLLCSRQVGAATNFLEEGRNGFSFVAANKDSLKNAMRKMIESSFDEIIEMGEYSHQLSKKISPQLWSKTLMEMLRKKFPEPKVKGIYGQNR